ncbi:MAG: AtpZ/AtpI family protein [Acidobacteria bacterium]|nr:AtpZ/AtpI family protein [Acidobacteriota bacterium]
MKQEWVRMTARYLGLAFLLPVSVFTGYLIGYWLDQWLGTGFLKIVFLLAGIAAGFVQLIREISRDPKR